MTEPRDEFESWLEREVEPLQPPPGTFEQIIKRARRRKRRRALLSAASAGAAAAVIVVAAVTLPRMMPSVLHPSPSNPAGNATSATSQPSSPQAQPSQRTQATGTPASTLPSVPPNFAATSVTFVGPQTGWVIGQAGTPGHCGASGTSDICTSMARTDNAGGSWSGLPAPATGPPDGASGVSQVRFLNLSDGWAYGPQLWATHDGGQTWTQVSTGGLRVISLETVGTAAFAVFAQCSGSGPDFAANCTRFYLYVSGSAEDHWHPVPGVASASGASGPLGVTGAASSSVLVLTSQRGYWYQPDGTLLGGPITGTAPWTAVSRAALPCVPGAPQPDGRPSGGQLAAATSESLALACPGGGAAGAASGQESETIYASSDGGSTWQQKGQLSAPGAVTSLAAGSGGQLVLGSTGGLSASADNGATWKLGQSGPPGGFSYAGLTYPTQGVAVPAVASQDAVWFTFNGGLTWRRSSIKNG